MGVLLAICWFAFWVWVLKGLYRAVTNGIGSAMSGDWGGSVRGTVGREWTAAEFSRLAQMDTQAQRHQPQSIDHLTGDLETTLRDEEASAREIEDAIAKRRNAIAQMKLTADEWRNRAEVAVSKGRDDLARQALTEAQQCEEGVKSYEAAIAELRPILDSYTDEIDELRRRLNEGLNRKLLAEARMVRAQNGERAHRLLQSESADLEVAAARYERQADLAEGRWQSQKMGASFGKRVLPVPAAPMLEADVPVEVTKRWDAAIERQLQDLKRREGGVA